MDRIVKAGRLSARLRNLANCLRRDPDRQGLPERILILLTSPRSGSTWLFDALRCHPAIYVHRSAVVYEWLGLRGRRYPRDLSGGPQSALELEVYPGQWERIPTFDASRGLSELQGMTWRTPFAIEKIHPEFFRFDTTTFLENVKRIETCDTKLRFVYQVRDPQASIVSFLKYQERNPTWYPDMKDDQLAVYMCKTYDTVLQVASRRQGLVVDYADIAVDLGPVLHQTFLYLWPSVTSEERGLALEVSQAAVRATSREERLAVGSSFLGKTAGAIKGSSENHIDFFDRFPDEMTRCYASYDQLLSLETMRQQVEEQDPDPL